MINYKLYWYLPAWIWGFFILILTSIPTPHIPSIGFELEDKVYHLAVYFVFGLLLARAMIHNDRRRLMWGISIVIFIGALFSTLDELHQHLIPGRTCDPWDAAADLAGIALALLLFGCFFATFTKLEKRIARYAEKRVERKGHFF